MAIGTILKEPYIALSYVQTHVFWKIQLLRNSERVFLLIVLIIQLVHRNHQDFILIVYVNRVDLFFREH